MALGVGLMFGGSHLKANADTITVKSGDTVSEIAQWTGDSVAHIREANHLNKDCLIFVGDKLVTNDTPAPQKQVQAPDKTMRPLQVQTPQPKVQVPQQVHTPKQQPAQPVTNGGSAEQSIIYDESRGQPGVSNGRYYGLYGMDISRLHGDLSEANQKAVAQKYMQERYGTWEKAWEFHKANNYW